MTEALQAAGANQSPRERLVQQGLAYIDLARERTALFRLMFADRRTVDPGAHAPAYEVLTQSVAAIVSGDVEKATLASWAIVHGLAMLALDGRLGEAEQDDAPAVLRLFAFSLA